MQTSENVAPNAKIDFGIFSEAFELFKSNAGTWIAVTLITGIIQIVISSLSRIGRGGPGNAGTGLLVWLIMLVISAVVNGILYAGLFGIAIKQIRGEQTSIGDLFGFTDVIGQTIIATIIVSILTTIGLMFCIFPGIVLAGLFMLTLPLVVDKKMNASEAVSTSINALKGQWLLAGVFAFIAGIIYIFGFFLCLVGVLVTAPVAILSVTVLYRNFFLGSSTPPSPGQIFEPAIPPGS
jgi:uncharacterized membrane protein